MGETNKNRLVVVPSFRKDVGIEHGHQLAVTSQEDGLKLTALKHRITRGNVSYENT